jgi:hypothetical protein
MSTDVLQNTLDKGEVVPREYVSRVRTAIADGKLRYAAEEHFLSRDKDGKIVKVPVKAKARGNAKRHKRPSGGFKEVLSFHGEKLPSEQYFGTDDSHFLYVQSRRNWLRYELGECEKECKELVKLSEADRIAAVEKKRAEQIADKKLGDIVALATTDPAMLEKLKAAFAAMGTVVPEISKDAKP